MHAKDAIIEYEQRAALLEDIIDKQAALIREYEEYARTLREMLRGKDLTHVE